MKLAHAKDLVVSIIVDVLEDEVDIDEDMELIGGNSLIDSIKLVEICLALEDKADEIGFEFDWTSDSAMSKSRSIFRSVKTLAQEFSNQSES